MGSRLVKCPLGKRKKLQYDYMLAMLFRNGGHPYSSHLFSFST